MLIPDMTTYSQIHEVGVFCELHRDIGPTTYIAPNEPVLLEYFYKYNKSPRHAYRFTHNQKFQMILIQKNPSRNQRGYRFENNNIKEVSLGLEFNFLILTFIN
jgi:hypothetical protein